MEKLDSFMLQIANNGKAFAILLSLLFMICSVIIKWAVIKRSPLISSMFASVAAGLLYVSYIFYFGSGGFISNFVLLLAILSLFTAICSIEHPIIDGITAVFIVSCFVAYAQMFKKELFYDDQFAKYGIAGFAVSFIVLIVATFIVNAIYNKFDKDYRRYISKGAYLIFFLGTIFVLWIIM